LSIAFTITLLVDRDDGRVSRLVAVVRDDTARWRERRELRDEVTRLRGASGDPAVASQPPETDRDPT
jgi:hypothetical protein